MKVIAHRGASAYLPEHTLPAKALAHGMGAHFLEQDLVASRDGELFVLHDIHLDRVTDVARRFPDRARDDGRYYAIDFTADEIRSLTVHERTNADGSAVFPRRFPVLDNDIPLRLHTLDDELRFVDGLNRSTGRRVGIYPEIKRPAWHREQGTDITRRTLDVLTRHGYTGRSDNAYVQCFDAQELSRIRHELDSDLSLVQLVGDNAWGEGPTDFAALCTPEGLVESARTVDGFGPWIELLYTFDKAGHLASSGLAESMHSLGRVVHPFTARIDALPDGFDTFMQLISFLAHSLSVDAVFTDFPDEAVLAAEAWS